MSHIICLEGPDGSGKTQAAAELVQLIQQEGHSVLALRAPGSTPLAEKIRNLCLHETDLEIPSEELAFLFMVAQISLERRANQATEDYVVMDRCWLSNAAYRGAEGMPLEKAKALAELAGVVRPRSQVFYLDVPDEVRAARLAAAQGRGVDRFESRPAGFAQEVARQYAGLADEYAIPVDTQQGQLNPREVAQVVWTIHQLLQGTARFASLGLQLIQGAEQFAREHMPVLAQEASK